MSAWAHLRGVLPKRAACKGEGLPRRRQLKEGPLLAVSPSGGVLEEPRRGSLRERIWFKLHPDPDTVKPPPNSMSQERLYSPLFLSSLLACTLVRLKQQWGVRVGELQERARHWA